MATDIGNRQVLKPAGNVARATLRKTTTKLPSSPRKPPPSSPRNPAMNTNTVHVKASPPNSQPSTPRTATAARSPLMKPSSPRSRLPSPKLKASIAPKPDKLEPIPCTELFSSPEVAPSSSPSTSVLEFSTKERNSELHETKLEIKDRSGASKAISQKQHASPVFNNVRTKIPPRPLPKVGSLSLDESSLASIVAAKKAAACEVAAQRKLKVAEYGRKLGKVSRVAPDSPMASLSTPAEPKRCKFITPQSDPLYVAYHDQEWGVPVHEDRMLFELLVLSGFQVELSWTTILHKREAYRAAFCGFDADAVAAFSEKHIQELEADKSLGFPKNKIRGVVENAQRILEVVSEFGSLDAYLWGFLNNQPIINNYRYPKQVPLKTSKAESMSKDLVRRGFRFVGPTIINSFMQAAGMTNDHLVECFRHQECQKPPSMTGTVGHQECPKSLCNMAEHLECPKTPINTAANLDCPQSPSNISQHQDSPESPCNTAEPSPTITAKHQQCLESPFTDVISVPIMEERCGLYNASETNVLALTHEMQDMYCTEQDWLSGDNDFLQQPDVPLHIRELEAHLEEKMAMAI